MVRFKPLVTQAAFTLLELVIALLLIAILSGYAIAKLSGDSEYEANAVAEQLVSSLNLTQQLSMNDSGRSFSLIINTSSVDLQADGASLNVNGFSFPQNFGSQVTLSPTGVLSFNSLGETTPTTLTVTAGSTQQVCIEASGYARLC